MIKFVLRFDADDERRVAILFEDDSGDYRAFQTMSAVLANGGAERMTGLLQRLAVVGNGFQITLDFQRRAVAFNNFPLFFSEFGLRRYHQSLSSVFIVQPGLPGASTYKSPLR